MTTVLVSLLVLLCGAWCAGFLYLALAFKRLPRLECEEGLAPNTWPRLSVIIPACNEAAQLESAVSTLLDQDYPNLEIILVDDRSSDRTGAIIDRFAKSDARIHALHIDRLPDGWLGKVHALHCGVAKASGDWLLFTDADVYFAPTTLRRALIYVGSCAADQLALIPRTIQKGFWLDVVVQTFGLLFLIATRAAGVNQLGSKSYVGIGAFNLVKADTFRRTPGFEWLRLEPGDDVGLGIMTQQVGGVSRLALAHKHLAVEWYPSVRAMFRGLEKNLFGPGANYLWWLMLLQVGGLWALAIAPWAALMFGVALDSMLLLLAGAAAMAAHSLFSLCCVENQPKATLSLLLFPFGLLLIGAMMLRAGYKCLKNDGIEWRGTHYPLMQLRQGQRVKFLKI
jgi:glycosyltransferase involved in cell wall biosynthesis